MISVLVFLRSLYLFCSPISVRFCCVSLFFSGLCSSLLNLRSSFFLLLYLCSSPFLFWVSVLDFWILVLDFYFKVDPLIDFDWCICSLVPIHFFTMRCKWAVHSTICYGCYLHSKLRGTLNTRCLFKSLLFFDSWWRCYARQWNKLSYYVFVLFWILLFKFFLILARFLFYISVPDSSFSLLLLHSCRRVDRFY